MSQDERANGTVYFSREMAILFFFRYQNPYTETDFQNVHTMRNKDIYKPFQIIS